jgi:hypothetical protein
VSDIVSRIHVFGEPDEIIRLRADNEHLRANLEAAVASHQEAVRELTLQLLQAQGQAADALAERDELQAVFDKTREANMRAIKRWQEVTGRDKSWPDHDYLILWLLEQWDDTRAALQDLTVCVDVLSATLAGQIPWRLSEVLKSADRARRALAERTP